MRIYFTLTDPGGSVIATGSDSTHTGDLGSWDNHSLVVRLLHASEVSEVSARLGQKLTMWVEADPAGADQA